MQPVQYPQQPGSMPAQYQMAYAQPTTQVVIVNTQGQSLSVQDIYIDCKPPQMMKCQECCGCCTCWEAGAGLCCGACCGCYDKNKPDCMNVFIAGCAMQWTAEFCIGWISGCIVGCRMMGCCLK